MTMRAIMQAPLFAGTGNFQNPVAIRERNKDNYATTQRVFGNVYGEADL